MHSKTVRVEFYGVVRLRTNREHFDTTPGTLAEVLRAVQCAFPTLAPDYIREGRPAPHLLVSLDGGPATDDPTLPLVAGATVVLVSAQSGG